MKPSWDADIHALWAERCALAARVQELEAELNTARAELAAACWHFQQLYSTEFTGRTVANYLSQACSILGRGAEVVRSRLEYEVVQDRLTPDTWRVAAINYAAVFHGPQAKERAEDYAVWMYQKAEEARRMIHEKFCHPSAEKGVTT